MLIAHLPSGYLLARGAGWRMAACLAGAVFPDLDMIRFWLEGGRIHHHAYFTHLPAFWAGVSLVALVVLRGARLGWALAFLAGVWLHLCLDTVAGDVMWLWPWSDRMIHLAEVPATYDSWVISFVLHWTFLLELGITAAAAGLFLRHRKT
ncbi:metal-dependent hydrolase [Stagnihabitans tardus]|uniref:Metal-dependent hydrolase n=1 Tax=Stagnihabitans tardus TaxID=2699202 RepID=A0AAE4Y6N8_9RHOB|nr:metal-dependent hydrolase [Stagnihabitans tardus]NBZ86102.1 metal-dependent hydrolase [Stagnihabitans tardus]